jgi:hypothetical protein
MRHVGFFLVLACCLAGRVSAAVTVEYAEMSCRTRSDDTDNGTVAPGDGNNHDSQKLTVRQGDRGEKSWIRFNLAETDLSVLRSAQLRVTLHGAKSGQCDLSAVNDDYTVNIQWVDHPTQANPGGGIYALTWNNAPGNDPASFAALNALQTTGVGRLDYTGGLAGSQYGMDVLSILLADTDGIVQFVLHNSTGDTSFATHDHPLGTAYYPALFLEFPPEGADFPDPAVDETVPTTREALAWTNPDPNDGVSAITCTVYLGTEPNRLAMDAVTLAAGAATVPVDTDHFPVYGVLQNNTRYYWVVDCQDPSREPPLIEGEMWSFTVGQAPSVDAGPDQAVWLGSATSVVVSLNGTTSDDGAYTVAWTQVENDAPAVTISPDNVDDTSVTLTERGDYRFMLTADDGLVPPVSDTVRIVVGNDSCDASHLASGAPYDPGDQNQDCRVDLTDLVALIIDDWLQCTDTLTDCEL